MGCVAPITNDNILFCKPIDPTASLDSSHFLVFNAAVERVHTMTVARVPVCTGRAVLPV